MTQRYTEKNSEVHKDSIKLKDFLETNRRNIE